MPGSMNFWAVAALIDLLTWSSGVMSVSLSVSLSLSLTLSRPVVWIEVTKWHSHSLAFFFFFFFFSPTPWLDNVLAEQSPCGVFDCACVCVCVCTAYLPQKWQSLTLSLFSSAFLTRCRMTNKCCTLEWGAKQKAYCLKLHFVIIYIYETKQ